jgi:hypothetical protein
MLTAVMFGLTGILESPWRGLRDQLRPRHGLTASLGKNRLEVSRNFHKDAEYDLTPTALMCGRYHA